MTTTSLEERKNHILAHEEITANRLARRVLDKPVPPIWMILIPVFFVFHAWRIKQYGSGLKDFAENYLVSRRRALETACRLEGGEDSPEQADADGQAAVPAEARPHFEELMSLLIDHYRALLAVRGNGYAALVRAHYRSKSNYMLFCNRLNKIENSFNRALLPEMEGEYDDLRAVVGRMEAGIVELRRRELDEIFS